MKKHLIFLTTGLLLLCRPANVRAQVPALDATAELGGYVADGDRTPFWLRANQWGRVPLAAPAGTARLGVHYRTPRTWADTSRHRARLSWEFGLETVGNVLPDRSGQVLLPEAYAKLRWGKWAITGGRERRIVGVVDTTLSTGSFSMSGNALPMPMLRLELAEYLPLGFLGNFFSLKGSFVHGWYDDPYLQDAYFHQKTFYGRLGKPEGRAHFQMGLVHHVTWGGAADYLKNSPVAVDGKLTTEFGDYVRGVIFAQIPKDKANGRFTDFDGTNRIGNHVGHIDMAFDWQIKNTRLLLYRQHPFEDASGLQFQNLPDGLYGLSLRREAAAGKALALRALLLEFLYTENQSGPTFDLANSRFKGGDNYFNHGQYREGWSYRSRGLGTPFIPPAREVRPELNAFAFPNNRSRVYHLGLEAVLLDKINLMAKFSYSLNSGTFNRPFEPDVEQFSSLLTFDAPLLRRGSLRLLGQVAYDRGELYPDSFGGYLGIRSSFSKK